MVPSPANTLTHEEARSFYDRFGPRQDLQIYERAAVDALCASADFGRAKAVLEFGCGTGAFARRLLERELPADARYLGLDVSGTMVDLARERVAAFAPRAEVRQTDGRVVLDAPDGSYDRFVSNYVFDLLSTDDMRTLLAEAHRVLVPGGLLGTTGLTYGRSRPSRWISRAWAALHARRPRLVGGCRPVQVGGLLDESAWTIREHRVVSSFGIASEVLVAEARAAGGAPDA